MHYSEDRSCLPVMAMAAMPRRECAGERPGEKLQDDDTAKTASHPALIQCRLHMRFEEAESI
mgnify:CR=1 FL=1